MERNRTALVIGIAAVALAVGATAVVTDGSGSNGAAAATTTTISPNTVSVSGTGSVEGVPDTLVADLHVHAREASVQEALNDSAVDARKVIASLHAHGVPASDIKTTDVSLDPDYNDHGEVDGYDSGESLTVRIHPLTKVGAIISAATTSAGNSVSVNNLSFDINDNTSLLAGARKAAFDNAKAAAMQYASLGGTSLSHVVRITSVVHNASPVFTGLDDKDALSSAAGDAASVPIRAGQQKVSVTVKVIWALG